MEYFPVPTFPPRKISTGVNLRSASSRRASTATCSASNVTSSLNVNEKSRLPPDIVAGGVKYEMLRRSVSVQADRGTASPIRPFLSKFARRRHARVNLPELRNRFAVHHYAGGTAGMIVAATCES